jgi:glycosyltransferase involved in cell wall biosynthesis
MSERLRVLLSAYACEPGKGSEPEVGWQWAMQMARWHDVTVLTRQNNRAAIDSALAGLAPDSPRPRFVFHDLGPLWLRAKKWMGVPQSYYVAWQRAAHEIVAGLLRESRFDLLHHVTFAAYRYPTALWGHSVPCIWGPLGGMESVPVQLMPWRHPRVLASELARNAANFVQAQPYGAFRRRARQSAWTLAASREVLHVLRRRGLSGELFPAVGLEDEAIDSRPLVPHNGPLRLLYSGNLLWLKGLDLALHALRRRGENVQFTLIGDGPYGGELRALAASLGLISRVEFPGRLSRAATLAAYREHDVFMFPSLHDSGGFAVLEAMAAGLPVICLEAGGPAVAVTEACGVRVRVGSREEVIAGLVRAIEGYDESRQRIVQHGEAARRRIADEYTWSRKAARMDEIYRRVAKEARV